MQTIKTAFVTAVLLIAGYGVWAVLDSPPPQDTPDFAKADSESWVPPNLEIDGGAEFGSEMDASELTGVVPVASLPAESSNTVVAADPGTEAFQVSPAGAFSGDSSTAPNPSQDYSQTSPASDISLPSSSTRAANDDFEAVWQAAQNALSSGKLAEALRSLSVWHNTPQLTPQQESRLLPLLDQLAGTVIYDRQHILDPPHMTEHGETLDQVARKYQVPTQTLVLINNIKGDEPLPKDTPVKVIRGPFKATISLSRSELTLWADGCYAGRFSVQVTRGANISEGIFAISEKLDPHHTLNADGQYLLAIDKDIRIHNRTPNPSVPDSIVVSDVDAQNLFALLAEGSAIEITR